MKYTIISILAVFIFGNKLIAQRNYKYENFGNRSILLNGNVTGSVDDLGATYYNPARLAFIKDPAFLINAKIYELSNIKIDNITIDGKNLSSSKFNGLPSMFAGTFKIKSLEGHHFAYSIFSRNQSDFSLGYKGEVTEIIDPVLLYSFSKYVSSTNINNKLRENWIGVSWATSISDSFSIGASLFGSDYKYEVGRFEELNMINDSDQVYHYNKANNLSQESYGLFAKIGAAWELPKFDLGVNINLPYLEVYGKGKFNYEEFSSGFGDDRDTFTYNNFDDLDSKRKQPFGISVGAGIPFKKNVLHVDLSYNAPISNYEKIDIPDLISETEANTISTSFSEELKSVLNIGVGTEFFISKTLNFYGSFSTDYSPYSYTTVNNSIENQKVTSDYFHYGLGVNISHKWANFIIGTIYSSGNVSILESPTPPITPIVPPDTTSKTKSNRWRFIIGIEVLFIDESKLKKYGIDKNIF